MKETNDKKEEIVDKSPNNEENINLNTTQLSSKIRLLFFLLFIILTFLFNLEAMGLIDKQFKYKTFYLKMFSFFILCLFPITQYDKMKSIMMFLPAIVLFYFNVTFIEISSTFLSLLSFFTKIYSLAYLRIWIDQLSMIRFKTLFMFILNIIALTGDKFSITLTQLFSFKHNAGKILLVQFLIFMIFFFTPNKYFFVHKAYHHYHKQIPIKDKKSDKKSKSKKNENEEYEIISIFINTEQEEKEKIQKKGQKIYQIFFDSCYLWSILGKSMIYYLTSVLDYAFKDYCEKVLSKEDSGVISNNYELLVSLLSITSSLIGGVLSIIIGGYDDLSSLVVVVFANILTLLATILLAYSTSLFSVYGGFCLLFFFSNLIMGNIEGYIIKSIPLKYKEFGINICGLITTLTYFLARIIYDYIKITFEKTNQFYAWRFCLAWFLFGFFAILLSCTFRYRDILKSKKKHKNEYELESFNDDENEDKDNENDDDDSYTNDKDDEMDIKNLRYSRKTFDSFNS